MCMRAGGERTRMERGVPDGRVNRLGTHTYTGVLHGRE